MRVSAYCFLEGVIFEPLPKPFSIKDGTAWISHDHEPVEPGKEQKIRGSTLSFQANADLSEFERPPDDPNDPQHKKQFERIGELLDKYRSVLNEIATAVEGLVSLSTIKTLPASAIGHVNVRLTADNPEEQKLIDEEKIMHTFGDVGQSRSDPNIRVGDANAMFVPMAKAEKRISALAIYLTGVRAIERLENEVAYTSFFRVIEGFLGDGTRNIERALQKKEGDIQLILKLDQQALDALHRILKSLSLPCTAKNLQDGRGIISDLVLLRHKLMHYNLKEQNHHFYTALRADLKRVVWHMHRGAFLLLREDLGMVGD